MVVILKGLLEEVRAMKSRTAAKGAPPNGGPYPSISSNYWQPAPVPSPYLVPGTLFFDFLLFFYVVSMMRAETMTCKSI